MPNIGSALRFSTNAIAVTGITAVLGTLGYYLYTEVISDNSVYQQAQKTLSAIEQDKELALELGLPLRLLNGRRQHRIAQRQYTQEKKEYMQSSFPISGSKRSGQVELVCVKNFDDEWDTHYLKVTIPGGLSKILVQPPAVLGPRTNIFDRVFKWNPLNRK